MDVLSEALSAMRMTSAIFFNAEFTAPWGFATRRRKTSRPCWLPEPSVW